MSFSQTINYDTAGSFVHDSSLVEFVGSLARLKKQDYPAQTFSQGYASSAGFTFAATSEFTGGVVRQKDFRPAGLLAYYAWTAALGGSGLDGNYGTTSVGVAVASGSPAVAGGFLDLTGASHKAVALANAATYAPVNVATIAFRYKAAYSGAPAAITYLVASGDGIANLVNYFALRHEATGHLFIEVYGSNGVGIGTLGNKDYGAIAFTAGTTYEIVVQLDITSGATKLFIDSVQIGATDTSTGARTAQTSLYVGDEPYAANSIGANFSIKQLSFYDQLVAPANCFLLQADVYSADTIILPTFAYSGVGSIQSWASLAITDVNAPRYILNSRYWNGSSWAASDGTYAEATPAATAIDELAMLPLANTLAVKLLFAASNSTQQSADAFLMTFVGQIYPTSDPSIVNVSGVDADGLLSFAATLAASGSDGVKFQIVESGDSYYWTGTAWATSDGTYAQANTAAEIEAHRADLDISTGVVLKLRAVLHSADGSSTPTLTSAVIGYDFFAPVPDAPTECIVYGFARDILGDTEATEPTLVVTLARSFVYADEFIIMPSVKEFPADDDGRFEASLVETATPGKTYKFQIRYVDAAGKTKTLKLGNATVPNSPSVNLAALTFT